ncbi:MAG: PQQ-dependent sugar dehydrogenase [Asticcacaulis sp.]
MKFSFQKPLVAGLCLLSAMILPACSRAGDVAAGKQAFEAGCSLCHDNSPAQARYQGPPLFGVAGRPVGAVKDFGYSEALKAAGANGVVWDDKHLDAFLADPEKAMPGTTMPVHVADSAKRENLIAYLKSLTGTVSAGTAKTAQAKANPSFDWHKDAPGTIHHVTVADLPEPFATDSAGNNAKYVKAEEGFLPNVPEGFTISLFASGVDNPRVLRMAPNGDLYVVHTQQGRISVYRNKGGTLATTPEVFAEGLPQPFGLAFSGGYAYVANAGSVVRIPMTGGKAQTLVADLATTSGHSTRDIVFSKDGQYMYVSVGSESNVAEGMGKPPANWVETHALGESWGSEAGRALVLRFKPDGSDRHVMATGIRNCVGLGLKPGTNELYCTTNERDRLGDDLVPDYFTQVKDGQFFGWPWYYLGNHEDPRQKGIRPDLAGKVSMPDVLFVSHSAPLGFVFYDAPKGAKSAFPASYNGSAFVALHGSWNRGPRTGSKVVRVRFENGKPTGEYEDFMTGLIQDDQQVTGRPVGVAVGPDGALYVSDDAGNKIWRIAPK